MWHRYAEAGDPIRATTDQPFALSEICDQVKRYNYGRGKALYQLFFYFDNAPELSIEKVIAACDRWLSGCTNNPWETA